MAKQTWVTLPPTAVKTEGPTRDLPNILVSWSDSSDSSNIGIRPYSNVGENVKNKVNSSTFGSYSGGATLGIKSMNPGAPNDLFGPVTPVDVSKRVIGSLCKSNSDCNSRVPRSHCSFGNICECLYSFHYDKATDSCFKVKSFNERCSSSFNDGCHNAQLRCSEYGVCTCHHGFHYEFGKNPYCQPNNSSSCEQGHTWDSLRARCVRPRIHTLFTDSTPHYSNGGYDRNRYSLFFSVVLILVLMVILFKSKKSHPFLWDRRSRRMSRSISYAEALGFAFGVRSPNGPPSHTGHIIPPPHQGGPFDHVPADFYSMGWNHHHHHHHHPHLQSLVVAMPHARGANSVDAVNGPCHLIPEVMTVPDGVTCTNSVPSSPSRVVTGSGDTPAHSTCIPPPPYASTLSLATACGASGSDTGDPVSASPDSLEASASQSARSATLLSTEKPPPYEEAIRYDATLLPVTMPTDLNNNSCTNPTGPCVAGNCNCHSHLPYGQNPQGFICLTTSPSVTRCGHTVPPSGPTVGSGGPVGGVVSASGHGIVRNGEAGCSSEMTDGTMVHKAYVPSSSESLPSPPGHGSTIPRAVVVSTTQHCSSTHVPYLTPPVHSLPYSARLRDYPYPVSPWPVAHGHSSRSERYRLYRTNRPINSTRSHFSRPSSGHNGSSNSNPSNTGTGSSFISLLRRGTSFMAGVTNRNRDHQHRHVHHQQSSNQGANRNLTTGVDQIRPLPLDESTATTESTNCTTLPDEISDRQGESSSCSELIASESPVRSVPVVTDAEIGEGNFCNNRFGEQYGPPSFSERPKYVKNTQSTYVKREDADAPMASSSNGPKMQTEECNVPEEE